MRLYNCDSCCKRWFVTFDDRECSPVPIDGSVFIWKGKGTKNLHRPRVIRGHCKISKQGAINIAFNLGDCSHRTPKGYGDAATGVNSAFRIYIEEVNAPQL